MELRENYAFENPGKDGIEFSELSCLLYYFVFWSEFRVSEKANDQVVGFSFLVLIEISKVFKFSHYGVLIFTLTLVFNEKRGNGYVGNFSLIKGLLQRLYNKLMICNDDET